MKATGGTSRIDFGRAIATIRLTERFSARIGLRVVAVVGVLAVLAGAVAVIALGTGDYTISPPDVLRTIFGEGSRTDELVVGKWRMPRVLLALMFGAALGASGAIFQSLTRNPLGSPDIIGFNTGAYTGALVVMLVTQGGYFQTAAGALIGGLATASVVYLLAFKNGVQGFRLIIVGIAISAMLQSVNTWMIVKTDLTAAMAAAVWGSGSLAGLDWAQVLPVAVALAVLLTCAAVLSHRLPVLDLGDEVARALGVRVEPTRLALVLIGVGLTALATAAAGPIVFVALAAPQLARRLTRTASVAVLPAAAMGALLLVLADWIAQRAFAPSQLPVGVVTVSIGGGYFVWLLAREMRR
ncbi:FecCD family ABC transporter permease [Nocardia sp. NPDC056064]|uniref:FecCD family ABC transporter permease n=1 Tax=Nocardia sp. NPDC056064 TaxID=3345701 RepID=UPI0035D572E3